jgi:hypothetical protein
MLALGVDLAGLVGWLRTIWKRVMKSGESNT